MKFAHLAICFGMGLSGLAFGHGGDGHNHPVEGASQMPASLTDSGGGGGGSTAISGSINLSAPSIKSVGGGGGGGPVGSGGGGEVALDAPAPVFPHLSSPNTVPNGTSRDVPTGAANPNLLVLDRYGTVAPRTNDSIQIYNRAYNADRELMNKWLKTLGN